MKLTAGQIKMMQEDMCVELAQILMERWNYSESQALSSLYNSDTFSRLQDPRTGFYYQSPGYVYSYLEDELTRAHI